MMARSGNKDRRSAYGTLGVLTCVFLFVATVVLVFWAVNA